MHFAWGKVGLLMSDYLSLFARYKQMLILIYNGCFE